MTKTWLIYALGGGWGHITRALSLGRIAATKTQVHILTNSCYANYLGNEGCLVQHIPDDAVAATCEQVRFILLNTNYARLIVDTFPRGLGGELADILPQLRHIPRILIHRDINPRYVTAKKLRSFVSENFDTVIVPGEGKDLAFSDLPNVQHTAPWLIRNAWELANISTTRSHILRVDTVKIILVCAAGKAEELPFFCELTLQLHKNFPECAVRILAANCPVGCPPALWVSHHPGIECFAAASVVVGGAGYNTVYECAAVGVPLVTLALPRLYDRQDKRASQGYQVKDISEAIATVKMLLQTLEPGNKLLPSYINGAVDAVRLISEII